MGYEKKFNKEKAKEFNDRLIKLIKEYKDQGVDISIKPPAENR